MLVEEAAMKVMLEANLLVADIVTMYDGHQYALPLAAVQEVWASGR